MVLQGLTPLLSFAEALGTEQSPWAVLLPCPREHRSAQFANTRHQKSHYSGQRGRQRDTPLCFYLSFVVLSLFPAFSTQSWESKALGTALPICLRDQRL